MHEPALLNFEASFGTLAWEGGGIGRSRAFDRDGELRGWARLVPGYSRIRASGVRDEAPPSLVWQVDPQDTGPEAVLHAIIDWAEERADVPFTTAFNPPDCSAAALLARRGYVHDATEPYSGYLSQPLDGVGPAAELSGYRFLTMVELDDLDARAEVHRLAWEGSTRSPSDVRATMGTWPYKPELDFIAVADDGSLAASALCWYDPVYSYGEFEPVGTARDHQGQGVGATLLRLGLRRLRQAGAGHAVVGARADDAYPVARRLYRSVGFVDITTQTIVRLPT